MQENQFVIADGRGDEVGAALKRHGKSQNRSEGTGKRGKRDRSNRRDGWHRHNPPQRERAGINERVSKMGGTRLWVAPALMAFALMAFAPMAFAIVRPEW
jgi:hypothetical protein